MTPTHVRVKNRLGKDCKWLIEAETINTYKIFSNGIITSIYKVGCYEIDGKLYSYETRNNCYSDYLDYNVLVYEDGEVEFCDVVECEDRSIDLGYLEDDHYGECAIYDRKGNKYYV